MFGERLKKLRLAHKLKQTDLADRIGVTKQCISNWENENIMPSLEMVKKLCCIFSCSADYLLELDSKNEFSLEINNLSDTQIAQIQGIVSEFQKMNQFHSPDSLKNSPLSPS